MKNKDFLKANPGLIEAIENETPVMVRNNDEQEWSGPVVLTGFDVASEWPFKTDISSFSQWKPVPKKIRRSRDAVWMMRWFVKHEYTPNEKGVWSPRSGGIVFGPGMWYWCGKEANDNTGFIWPEEWIEETEE